MHEPYIVKPRLTYSLDLRACRMIVEGCTWMTKYYLTGCPSWQWYYPFHYSPYPSDLCAYLEGLQESRDGAEDSKKLVDVRVEFEEGAPLAPFEQLLAVLPPERYFCYYFGFCGVFFHSFRFKIYIWNSVPISGSV